MKTKNLETNSVKHFERVLTIAKNLTSKKVAIRGHEYYPHFFGMWKIIAGSFEHRFQFLWDDRDQVLSVSETDFEEFGNPISDWKQIDSILIDARKGADPFKYIEDFFK